MNPRTSSSGRTASIRAAAALILVLASSACRGEAVRAETLPFHVAVIPFENVAVSSVDVPSDESWYEDHFVLRFEGRELAGILADSLRGFSFTDVTLLDPPDGVSAEDFASWSPARREEHWLRSARDCRADLLLEAEVRLDPVVRSRIPQAGAFAFVYFPLNTLLKVVTLGTDAGLWAVVPFANDVGAMGAESRKYTFDVGLDGSLHELGSMLDPASQADLENDRAEVARISVHESEARLRFAQTTGLLGYPAAFVVPAPLLPTKRRKEQRSLREHVAGELLRRFVQQVDFRKRELMAAEGLVPFAVEELTLGSSEAGAELRARVLLSAETVDAMEGYRVWVAGELVADVDAWQPSERLDATRVRYDLSVVLPALAPSTPVRLELRDAALKQNVRTFTLRVGETGRVRTRELAVDWPRSVEG